jgi:hypothetical protein
MTERFHSFDNFLNEQILNEIGEGVSTFDWHRTGHDKVATWMSDMSQHERGSSTQINFLPQLTYEFKSDKATYVVKIVGQFKEHNYINFGQKPATKPHDYELWIGVSFDVVGSTGKEVITNFGEQFRVISTVSSIIQEVMKEIQQIQWVKVQEIHLAPKLEDSDEGKPITQTKRGRIYLEYIKKQGKKLEGKWTAEIRKDRFVLKSGTWRSSSGNLIPLSETV